MCSMPCLALHFPCCRHACNTPPCSPHTTTLVLEQDPLCCSAVLLPPTHPPLHTSVVFRSRLQEPKACSIVLRGASKDVLNEVERNLHDAMGVARNVCIGACTGARGALLGAAFVGWGAQRVPKEERCWVPWVGQADHIAHACQHNLALAPL